MRQQGHRFNDVIEDGSGGAAGDGCQPDADDDEDHAPARADDVSFDGENNGDIPANKLHRMYSSIQKQENSKII